MGLLIRLGSAVFLALLAPTAASAAGVPASLPEREVKAAFLFNFAKFVEWPPEALGTEEGPFRLCLIGGDPFDKALDRMVEGKSVHERALVVQTISSPIQGRGCHLLFIAPSEEGRLPDILSALDDAPVLTVGDTRRFVQKGGMIQFLLEEKKIRFHINQDRAAASGLKISSQLMKLAKEKL